jgi:hypothetical protein
VDGFDLEAGFFAAGWFFTGRSSLAQELALPFRRLFAACYCVKVLLEFAVVHR